MVPITNHQDCEKFAAGGNFFTVLAGVREKKGKEKTVPQRFSQTEAATLSTKETHTIGISNVLHCFSCQLLQ